MNRIFLLGTSVLWGCLVGNPDWGPSAGSSGPATTAGSSATATTAGSSATATTDTDGTDATTSSGGGCVVSDAVQIAAGSDHTCVLTATGEVRCWGRNSGFQVGAPSRDDASPLFTVVGLAEATSIAAGTNASCAIAGGTLWCWGANDAGELGDGSETPRALPARVLDLPGSPIFADGGAATMCAVVDTDGDMTAGEEVYCWGNNSEAQLAATSSDTCFNDVPCSRTPLRADLGAPLSGIAALSFGRRHACVIGVQGDARCWGSNSNGQLGDGSEGGYSFVGLGVTGFDSGTESISTGGSHTCAIRGARLHCWGSNYSGNLGTANGPTPLPVELAALGQASVVSLGHEHTCAVDDRGLWCWGLDDFGQSGPGIDCPQAPVCALPSMVDGVQYEAIALGDAHTCTLTDGCVRCFGDNTYGQLGTGS